MLISVTTTSLPVAGLPIIPPWSVPRRCPAERHFVATAIGEDVIHAEVEIGESLAHRKHTQLKPSTPGVGGAKVLWST